MSQLKTLHSRRFLLIYLAVVILMLLALTQQYATDDQLPTALPGSKTFHPTVSLPQLLLKTDTGVRSNVHLKQQWTYFVFSDPGCQQHCDAPLRVIRAVRSALGGSAPAVFVLTKDETHCPSEASDSICGVYDDKQQRTLLQTAGITSENPEDGTYSNIILLINPQAKLQRRYQLPLNSNRLIEDFIAQRRAFANATTSVQRR